jgi:metal-dependent amidase/aminoacylase/carboxypeptidase family protein
VKMLGTLRNFNESMRSEMHDRIKRTAEKIAEASGATAHVRIRRMYGVTDNHKQLTQMMLPTLAEVAPANRLFETNKTTGAEDFSFYQKEIPGLFIFLGITPKDQLDAAASNHSPLFYIDESGLLTGVKALGHLTLDYMKLNPVKK